MTEMNIPENEMKKSQRHYEIALKIIKDNEGNER